jgi:hypothetical protein
LRTRGKRPGEETTRDSAKASEWPLLAESGRSPMTAYDSLAKASEEEIELPDYL